jgi:hypothetical protein
MSQQKRDKKRKKQEKGWAREATKREACRAKAAATPKREPKPPREPKQNRRPDDFGFTIFDGGSGKVMQFDNREQGLSAARAMCACDEVDDAIARNDVLNDAMPTVPDDSGVTNAVGHPLRAYGENRMPAHLFPASKMFALMPCEAKDYRSLEVIRDMWVGSTFFKRMSAVDFIYSLHAEDARLPQVWQQYAISEQRYMDDWAFANAESSKSRANSSAPTTVDEMVRVLEEARAAFRRAYDIQARKDGDSVAAYMNICVAPDEHIERLLATASPLVPNTRFGIDEGDLNPHGYLTLDSGNTEVTCCAAGYLEAVEVLRANGVGCAPWAQWD